LLTPPDVIRGENGNYYSHPFYMLVQDIINKIRRNVAESGSGVVDDTHILLSLNEYQNRLAGDQKTRGNWNITIASLPLINGSATLPVDYLDIWRVYNGTTLLNADVGKYSQSDSSTYRIVGTTISIPDTTSTDTLTVIYFKKPTVLLQANIATQTPDIPEQYQELYTLYGTIEAFNWLGDTFNQVPDYEMKLDKLRKEFISWVFYNNRPNKATFKHFSFNLPK
jgi:hypothetical protein